MANQSASPAEAAIAKAKLVEMGEPESTTQAAPAVVRFWVSTSANTGSYAHTINVQWNRPPR